MTVFRRAAAKGRTEKIGRSPEARGLSRTGLGVVILKRELSVDYRLPAALQLALQFGMAPRAALTEALCGLEFERRLEYPRGHSICVGDRAQRPLTPEASLWPFNPRACYLARCQRRCRLRQSSRSETSATSTRRCGNTTKRLSTNQFAHKGPMVPR